MRFAYDTIDGALLAGFQKAADAWHYCTGRTRGDLANAALAAGSLAPALQLTAANIAATGGVYPTLTVSAIPVALAALSVLGNRLQEVYERELAADVLDQFVEKRKRHFFSVGLAKTVCGVSNIPFLTGQPITRDAARLVIHVDNTLCGNFLGHGISNYLMRTTYRPKAERAPILEDIAAAFRSLQPVGSL